MLKAGFNGPDDFQEFSALNFCSLGGLPADEFLFAAIQLGYFSTKFKDFTVEVVQALTQLSVLKSSFV